MNITRAYGRMIAALISVVLLIIPLILAGFPRFTRSEFPGPYTRIDAIIIFFGIVPLLFTLLAAYRVAQYRGLIGGEEDTL